MKWALLDDYDAVLAEDRPSAVEAFGREKPPVVLLDLGLPPHPGNPQEGLAALSDLLSQDPLAKIVIITGQSEKENALQAIGQGAYDFLCKPVEMDELRFILKRALHVAQLEKDYREMQGRLRTEGFHGMLGASPQMQELFASIRKIAATDAPVLILGESGTGKEMAALAIHRQSGRKDGPFAAINCGAIPETLLESELFGHEKGAFTGAHTQRKGRIEAAGGGTLFLDEIGELTPALQVKLLRFLQDQKFERVGGRSSIQIDTRVMAATNSDLKKSLEQGTFREDLYFRLAVVVLRLPPLRERPDDIPLLAKAFLNKFSAENGRKTPTLSSSAARALQQYDWPGNVRELENRIRRAVIMVEGTQVTPADLELIGGGLVPRTLREARESLEKEMIEQALRRHSGKISRAADELGVSRPTLYEMMEKLGIKRE